MFLAIMSGIGVTIAVLSIVNTMLMSVTERIIEFGILKANGWSRYDVMRLITSESAVLGLFGGISGCLVGWFGDAGSSTRSGPTASISSPAPGLLLVCPGVQHGPGRPGRPLPGRLGDADDADGRDPPRLSFRFGSARRQTATSSFISRTARSKPTSTARATML